MKQLHVLYHTGLKSASMQLCSNEKPMSELLSEMESRLTIVQRRIERACERAGRSANEVKLLPVTKTASLDAIQILVGLGYCEFGENRPQQLLARAEHFGKRVEWHLIGQLQRNKVRGILPHTVLIHSVDSMRLLERISQVTCELDLRPKLLLEVNISGESSKSGFSLEELLSKWPEIVRIEAVEIRGLMTMAPFCDDPSHARPIFRGLRELREKLQHQTPEMQLPELSMGMSNDFEVAVEEGATIVRVGSLIFSG